MIIILTLFGKNKLIYLLDKKNWKTGKQNITMLKRKSGSWAKKLIA